jgi:hypothetical protein
LTDSVAKWAPENSIAYICGRELFLMHVCIFFDTDPRTDMVYGRRQPRTKNTSFEFRRREGFSSAHEITEVVPEPPRRSKRSRINLPRGAMHIEDSEPESTSSDDEEGSPYRQEPSVVWTSLGPLPRWVPGQILGGPFGLFGLCHTAPDDVRCKDYGGEVLG